MYAYIYCIDKNAVICVSVKVCIDAHVYTCIYNVQDTTEVDKDLVEPPEGYDSVRGVKETDQLPSFFKVLIHYCLSSIANLLTSAMTVLVKGCVTCSYQ